MEALVCSKFGAIEDLKWGNLPDLVPADQEVLIAPAFSGVNFPDTLIVQGTYQFKPDLPFAPGGEVAGEVLAVGAKVTRFKKGDAVIAAMGWGGFASQCLAQESNTFHLPAEVSLEKAACLMETFGTAIHALKDRALMLPGETLVVLGASGGTGNAAVQLGRLFGARVIAVASTEEKRQLALKSGAHQAIDPATLKESIKKLGGADVVFDPVGGPLSEEAFRTLRPGGRHLIVGFASGAFPSIPLNLPLLKSASLVGVFWGNFWRNNPQENRRNIRLLLKWLEEEKIDPVVSKVYPVQDGVKALKEITDRKVLGKVVLKF